MAVSKKVWLGVATEATSGTAIATPTVFIPTKASFKNQTKYVYANDDRGTRDANNARVATVRLSSWDSKGNWYNDTSPYLLLAMMGLDTPSQPAVGTDPTVWSHALTLADVPKTLTLSRQLDAVTAYQSAYGAVEKMSFKWNADGKLLECDSTLTARYAAKIANLTRPADTTVLPFAGYLPTISLFGSQSTDIEDMQIDVEQKVEAWYGSGGSQGQNFDKVYFGDRTAKLSFTARFDTTTLMDDFDATTEGQVIVTFTGQVISHTYNESLIFTFPIVGFDTADIDTSKNNIGVKVTATARPGTAVNSLFTATVQNTVASYTV
jgi:hypothetical protein